MEAQERITAFLHFPTDITITIDMRSLRKALHFSHITISIYSKRSNSDHLQTSKTKYTVSSTHCWEANINNVITQAKASTTATAVYSVLNRRIGAPSSAIDHII